MKKISCFLTMCIGCAVMGHVAFANIATTAGSNLTGYNPSDAFNNQWATMSNARSGTTKAKADFGNCNSLILRCAQPKCGNGGCTDASVASAIVSGCVQSNSSCKQYGDDLISYMTAQLVASSNVKINEQKNAVEIANAQAAAAAQSEQLSAMQNQMYQMQQQMANQQAESAQQLQDALAAQAAQNQAAIESVRAAATEAAQQNEAGISNYQQNALDRGVAPDVLERKKIAGQIETEIENAEVSLKEVQRAMMAAFDYAGCDARGNNCKGPKRIKKWRELASEFMEPYDNVLEKLDDAIDVGQMAGLDMSQVYMMVSGSCNSWAQYMCPKTPRGEISYGFSNGSKSTPMVCVDPDGEILRCQENKCKKNATEVAVKDKDGNTTISTKWEYDETCKNTCMRETGCFPCTFLKALTDGEDVYEGWVNGDDDVSKGNVTVVACASSALDNSSLLSRRRKKKNGAGLVDLEQLDSWINQVEPSRAMSGIDPKAYCDASSVKEKLEKAALSKSINKKELCVTKAGGTQFDKEDECSYINPLYAICDVHAYNAGVPSLTDISSGSIDEIKSMVALKTTVFSQQMYKQYEYLKATLRRFAIQIEKIALTSTLEAASGSKSSGSSGLLGGKNISEDNTIHLAGAQNCSNLMDFDSAYNCLQSNVSLILSSVGSNYKKACLQLRSTYVSATMILKQSNYESSCLELGKDKDSKSCPLTKDQVTSCAQAINFAVMSQKKEDKQQTQFRGLNSNFGS